MYENIEHFVFFAIKPFLLEFCIDKDKIFSLIYVRVHVKRGQSPLCKTRAWSGFLAKNPTKNESPSLLNVLPPKTRINLRILGQFPTTIIYDYRSN